MQIEYELNADDWAAFGEHCARTAPEFQKARHVGVVIGMLLILAVAGTLSAAFSSHAWLVVGMIVAVGWGWYWPRHLVSHARSHMRNREHLCIRGRHVMAMAPEGLTAKCEVTESLVRWPGVQAMVENGEHIFVMLNDVQGYVVPKRRVTSGDVDEFVRKLREYRTSSPCKS